jgi:hypothetical protein
MFLRRNLFGFVFLLCIRARLQSCRYWPAMIWALAPVKLLLRSEKAQGLTPNFVETFMARLKSCPDTKPPNILLSVKSIRTFKMQKLQPETSLIPPGIENDRSPGKAIMFSQSDHV